MSVKFSAFAQLLPDEMDHWQEVFLILSRLLLLFIPPFLARRVELSGVQGDVGGAVFHELPDQGRVPPPYG